MRVTTRDPERGETRQTVTSLAVLLLMVFALTWVVWVPRALDSQGIIRSDLAVTLGAGWTYAPAAAAFLFLALQRGQGAVVALGRRLLDWRIGWRWLGIIVAVPAVVAIGTAVVTGVLGGGPGAALPVVVGMPAPLILVTLVTLALTDGVGEETAWRGVTLPYLLTLTNAAAASLVLGLVWALWHVPLLFTRGAVMAGASLPLLLALLPAQAVFYTWVYQHTRGSVLAAALLHGVIGLMSRGSPVAEATGRPELVRLALWWIVAALLVARYGRNLTAEGRSPRPGRGTAGQ